MIWRAIDNLTGSDPRRDFSQAMRVRIAFVFSIVLAAIAGLNAIVLYASESARPWMAELGVAGTLLSLSFCGLLFYTRRPNLVLGLCAFFATLIFFTSVWGNRGGFPPATAYIPVVLLGVCVAWGWRAAVAATPLLAAYFGSVLYLGQQYAGTPTGFEPGASLPLIVAASIAAVIWIIVFGSLIRSANTEAAEHLREQNEELARLVSRAESASRAKSEFLANMGHEIRTPLNGVLGMANILLHDDTQPQEQKERLTLIRDSGENLLELLNDILDLSQIESGALTLDNTAFDLKDVLETSCALWQDKAEEKGLDFALAFDSLDQPIVQGDPVRLRQVLNNLLGNAVKFTSRGEIIVKVKQDREGDEVVTQIAVSDTGIGIPPDKQEDVFESFSQVDTSIKRRYGGTGLGLAISFRLAKAMRGDLVLTSQLGTGSTFTLSIRNAQASSAVEAQAEPDDPPIVLDRPLRILLVDDVATNLRVLGAMLKQALSGETPQIDTAAGGREAVNRSAAADYDIIFMDIQMPEMDGVTALRCIRENRRAAATRIVAVTALASQDNRRALSAEGFCDYLPKPVNAAALHTVLARLLDGAPERRAS